MPPKKKEKKAKQVVDGVNTTTLTRTQLEEYAMFLCAERDKEKEQKQWYHVERNKIQTFWDITKNQLAEAQAELRNKNQEKKDFDERHSKEVTELKEMCKHVLYEQQNGKEEFKINSMLELRQQQENYDKQENEIRNDINFLKNHLRAQKALLEDQYQNEKTHLEGCLYEERQVFDTSLQETTQKMEKKHAMKRQNLEYEYKMEIDKIENFKEEQITNLISSNAKALSDIKGYYNDICVNNLYVIKNLKSKLKGVKKQNERISKNFNEVTAKNKKLTEPLVIAQRENGNLRSELANYYNDESTLQNLQKEVSECKSKLEHMSFEQDVFQLNFDMLEAEYTELYRRFVNGCFLIKENQCKVFSVLVDQREFLEELVVRKDIKTANLATAANIVPYSRFKDKLKEFLNDKNILIEDLQYKLAQVNKAYDDLLQTYQAKMNEHSIPIANIEFKPLKSNELGLQRNPWK